MSSENAEKLVAEGIEALANEDHQLALNSLERALKLERTPLTGSCLAYCLAKVRENYSEAIPLAREAVDREPENPPIITIWGGSFLCPETRNRPSRFCAKAWNTACISSYCGKCSLSL